MGNIEITEIDTGALILGHGEIADELLTLAGADELKAGTILARDSVSLKLRLYVKGGATNENGIPKVVLPYALSAAAAGDHPVRVLVGGKVNRHRLVIDADGDASNVDGAVLDRLRDYGIVASDVQQLAGHDNLGGADS